jgi:predicted XRE-type DNA-binding protein
MPKEAAIKHEQSSGNVFSDVGLPGEYLAKAELVSKIDSIITERGLTQAKAAALMGIDQPRVSALLCGKLGLFSLEKLLVMLSKLGNRIEISIKASHESPSITVVPVVSTLNFRGICRRVEVLATPAFHSGHLNRGSISAEQVLTAGSAFPYWAMTEDRKGFYSHA